VYNAFVYSLLFLKAFVYSLLFLKANVLHFAKQVVDIATREISNVFQPMRKMDGASKEPPVTKMFLSADGQWLAAVNCSGDIYIFNLEVQRYASQQFDSLSVLNIP
jgi:hypothetical protein